MTRSIWINGLGGLAVVAGLVAGCFSSPNGGNGQWSTPSDGCASPETYEGTSTSSGAGGGQGGAGSTSSGMGGDGMGGGIAIACNNNGLLDTGEECDDGNIDLGDGCEECKLETCYVWNAQAGQALHVTAGTPCDNGMFCNDAAQCGTHCLDKVQDVDETGIDCGGADCDKCIAEICTADSDCASGFCADGVCCAKKCDQTCFMCNLPGSEGSCALVPTGIDDPTAAIPCAGTTKETCDTGVCISGGDNKLQNGEMCNGNLDCAIDLCSPVTGTGLGEKKCGLAQGQPCLLNAQCAVGVCTVGTCGLPKASACLSNFQCASGICSGGNCI